MSFKNPATKRKYFRNYWKENKDQINEQARNRRKKNLNKERKKDRLDSKRFRENNPEYHKVWQRRDYAQNTEHYKQKSRNWQQKLRFEVLSHYGKFCKCCGENNPFFLTIDHKNGGGTKHREKVGRGAAFYRWLKKKAFPKGFQTLCMNCNWAKGQYGFCPHEEQ